LYPKRKEAFATAVVIDCAYQLNRGDIVLALTRRLVLPLLEKLSDLSPFNEVTLRQCLYSGREQADVLWYALHLYTGPLFDKALADFKDLLRAKPAEAQRIVSGFAGNALPAAFDHSPEVRGLTEALSTLRNVRILHLIPFVLVEAHWVDNQQDLVEVSRFRDALHRIALDTYQANAAAIPILPAIREKAARGRLPVTYSLLLEWVADKASTLNSNTLEYLASVLNPEQNPHLLDWAPAIRKVYVALCKHQGQNAAFHLSRRWWLALAECRWDTLSTDGPPVATDSEILRRWLLRVAELGEKPGEDDLLTALREIAAKLTRDRKTALRRLELEAYIAAGEIKRGQLGFEEAVNRLDKMTRGFVELRSADFTDYALKYLLDKVPELAQEVPNLINSGNVLITVKSALLDAGS
jgi:hypothetical protein